MKHISTWLVVLALLAAGRAEAAMTDAGQVQLELVAAAASIAPGQTLYVAVHEKILPGWHTYWRNPGDAGEAPKLDWTLPAGWKTGDVVWPAPKRLPVGPLMDYGYENEVYLPVPVTAPVSAPIGKPATLKAAVSILVCKDVCVPEDATVRLDLPVSAGPAPASNPAIAAALAAAPKGPPLQAAMSYQGGVIRLAVLDGALHGPAVRDAYFYPYSSSVIDQPKPQAVERGPGGLTLTLQPGAAFKTGPSPASLDGVLEADGKPYQVHARRGPLPTAAAGLGPIASSGSGSGSEEGGGIGALALAAGAAFLGGIVLNLMPCVFPILSMKALGLAAHAGEARRSRAHGLAFLAGVLITFVALAAVLITAKAAGAAVGWGFQLQSPAVVATLSLVMLLIGLNLSGLYEAGLSLQSAAAQAGGSGLLGSLLTGALAVVVAAPCTAPFMAGAIAYALTQPEALALVVFAALGLGFAAPFTLIAMAPRLLGRLPRPGPWMEGLKKILAFPMYGAAAWLLYVLTLQAGTTAMAALLASGVVLALAAWLYGAGQRARMGGRRPLMAWGFSALAAIAAVACAVGGVQAGAAPISTASAASSASGLPEEPYSTDRLAALQAQGRPVFVDFTAAWCITCQVNEKTSLTSPAVLNAFKNTHAVYLKADWTRRDPEIAETLAAHGRAGVPLYLVYGKGGGDPQTLPQILTSGTVIAALNKAAGA
jgi:thiol:disulfide interchange protein DsbD